MWRFSLTRRPKQILAAEVFFRELLVATLETGEKLSALFGPKNLSAFCPIIGLHRVSKTGSKNVIDLLVSNRSVHNALKLHKIVVQSRIIKLIFKTLAFFVERKTNPIAEILDGISVAQGVRIIHCNSNMFLTKHTNALAATAVTS